MVNVNIYINQTACFRAKSPTKRIVLSGSRVVRITPVNTEREHYGRTRQFEVNRENITILE